MMCSILHFHWVKVCNGNSRQLIVDTETSRRSTVCVVCETEFSRPSDKKRR